MKRSSVLILVLLVAVVVWLWAYRCGSKDQSAPQVDPQTVTQVAEPEAVSADPHGWLEVETQVVDREHWEQSLRATATGWAHKGSRI